MKYQAKIENGIVVDIIVTDNNFINIIEGDWVDYNENNIVGVGHTYTLEESFRSPKPFDSWIWNDTGKYWEAPIPVPDEENIHEWDEENQSWITTYMKV